MVMSLLLIYIIFRSSAEVLLIYIKFRYDYAIGADETCDMMMNLLQINAFFINGDEPFTDKCKLKIL